MQLSLGNIDGRTAGVGTGGVLARPRDDGARGGEFLDGDDLGDAGDEIGELDALDHGTIGVGIELGTELSLIVDPHIMTIERFGLEAQTETEQFVENRSLLWSHINDCHDGLLYLSIRSPENGILVMIILLSDPIVKSFVDPETYTPIR